MPTNDLRKLRSVDWALNKYSDQRAFEEKVRKCYNPVKNFVDKEIEKGISPYLAIDKVLNSKGLEKMYQELKNDAVKRTIRNILLNKYFRDTNKEKEEEKETEGEERYLSIESIKKKSLEEHIPIIMDDTLEVIKEILIKEKPARILEIGTATGYSSICFATILLENCIDEDSSSILIDTIELDEERASEAIKNIKEMNLTNTINVFIGNAVEILPTFNEKYDIIFIDAAKGKYPIFLKEAIRLSHKNTIILADNILYKGYVMSDYNKHKQRTAVTHLREYIKEATEDKSLETKILEVGDGLAISKVLI